MIPIELQRLFAQMQVCGGPRGRPARSAPVKLTSLATRQLLDREAVSTQHLTTFGFKWTAREETFQHDVFVRAAGPCSVRPRLVRSSCSRRRMGPSCQELNHKLYQAVEASLKGTPAKRLIESLYNGKIVNQTQCVLCQGVREREEASFGVEAYVSGHNDLVSSFFAATAFEEMEGVDCERCDARVCA